MVEAKKKSMSRPSQRQIKRIISIDFDAKYKTFERVKKKASQRIIQPAVLFSQKARKRHGKGTENSHRARTRLARYFALVDCSSLRVCCKDNAFKQTILTLNLLHKALTNNSFSLEKQKDDRLIAAVGTADDTFFLLSCPSPFLLSYTHRNQTQTFYII
jgi:hypothetical protein